MRYTGLLLYLDRDAPCYPDPPPVDASTGVAPNYIWADAVTSAFDSGRAWGKDASAFKAATGRSLLPSPRSRWKWRR